MDVLNLGGFNFDGYSTPAEMMAGGDQAMVVHKLPGGARVIDTLGPDEADISWSGFFWGNYSYFNAQAIDQMRASGAVVPLTFGGQHRSVIVKNFIYKIRRLPVWIEYSISCCVVQNASLGNLAAAVSTIDSLILSDLAFAGGL